jgi:quinol monooxygenase YgiN
MHFRENEVENFLKVFNDSKDKIRNFEGCLQLKLLKHKDSAILFTYSQWENEFALENYRNSELFISTWKKTKILFEKKAEAWTVDEIASL